MTTRIVFLLLALLAVGCGESTGPSQGDMAVAPEWVTGAASQALDAGNRFILAPLPPVADELSRENAVAVANAFLTTLVNSVGNLREALEEQHAAPINFAALTLCGRVIPVEAPFLPAPLRPEAQYARNMMAAKYAFEFCQRNGVKAVGLEVSAATTVTIATDGTLRYPKLPIIGGNDFLAFGIPLRRRPIPGVFSYGLWALSPEAAVQAVYNRVHTPIRSVPQATGCQWALVPCDEHGARHWRLETAEPVLIRRQGAAPDELAQVFYVQVGVGAKTAGGVYVASQVQPPTDSYIVDFPDQPVIDTLALSLAHPLAMDSFTLARPSN